MFDAFKVSEEMGVVTGKPRIIEDKFHMYSDVEITVRDKDGNLKSYSKQHNLRTTVGIDFWNTQLFTISPGTNGANYLALTTDATSPVIGDTTLASEETLNGLARIQVTPTHTGGVATTTFTNTWTYSGGTSKTLAKAGLFDATSAGHLVLETLFNATATVNTSGDTITLTWTVNY